MKNTGWTRSCTMVAVGLLLGACSFFTSKPDTPEQQATLDVIESTMRGVCVVVAREEPKAAKELQSVLRVQVLPVVTFRAEAGASSVRRGIATDDIKALIKDWDKYLGVGLSMVKALAVSQGWIDTDAAYWGAVNRVFVGCLAGLDAVLGPVTTPVADS